MKSLQKKHADRFRFRQWSRKTYAAFASLHIQVSIGFLKEGVIAGLFRKNARFAFQDGQGLWVVEEGKKDVSGEEFSLSTSAGVLGVLPVMQILIHRLGQAGLDAGHARALEDKIFSAGSIFQLRSNPFPFSYLMFVGVKKRRGSAVFFIKPIFKWKSRKYGTFLMNV